MGAFRGMPCAKGAADSPPGLEVVMYVKLACVQIPQHFWAEVQIRCLRLLNDERSGLCWVECTQMSLSANYSCVAHFRESSVCSTSQTQRLKNQFSTQKVLSSDMLGASKGRKPRIWNKITEGWGI